MITIADGTKIHAHGTGEIKIHTALGVIRLTNVWHVPTIGASLMSVARIVDAGYMVGFEQSVCYVSKDGMRTELGKRNRSLYHVAQNNEFQSYEENTPNQANLGLATNQSPSATLETWHRRLCYRTLDSPAVNYISSKVRDMEVSNTSVPSTKICGVCALGPQHKEAETKAREKATELLSVVHSDLCGPMETATLNGEKYFITFTDERSGRVSISLLPTKDGALSQFQAYRSQAEKASGKMIKALRTDGGGEYLNKEFKKYLVEAGIHHIVTPPYSPSQNGLAERMNRRIMETARCLLLDSQISFEFWGHAVLTAAHVHNRLPSRSHNNTSPIAFWTGKEPSIGHLRVFGSTAWLHIPKEKRRKLAAKSLKGILVGYEEEAGSKVYRVYDTQSKRVLLSRDVIIDEAGDTGEKKSTQRTSQKTRIDWDVELDILPAPESSTGLDSPNEFQRLDRVTPPPEDQEVQAVPNMLDEIILQPRLDVQPNTEEARGKTQGVRGPAGEGPRRSQRYRTAGENFHQSANFALMAKVVEPEPQTLTEALNSEAKVEWKQAWESELSSLAKNQTWVLEPLPIGRTAIGCRWLFQRKQDG